MRLDELFARKAHATVWTKTGRTLVCDDGDGVAGLRSRTYTNILKVKTDAEDA
jgi:hypothetical protein